MQSLLRSKFPQRDENLPPSQQEQKQYETNAAVAVLIQSYDDTHR